MRAQARGITLLELLIGLAVLAILTMLVAPGLQGIAQRGASETVVTELARMMATGRATAVTHGSMVSLCSLQTSGNDLPTCRKGQWLSPLTLFTDHNGDSKLNANDTIVSEQLIDAVSGTLLFRSFPAGRSALQFNQLGFTNNQTGNLLWCASNKDARTAHLIIFSNTGRARLARDKNGDGIREGSDGKNLSCP